MDEVTDKIAMTVIVWGYHTGGRRDDYAQVQTNIREEYKVKNEFPSYSHYGFREEVPGDYGKECLIYGVFERGLGTYTTLTEEDKGYGMLVYYFMPFQHGGRPPVPTVCYILAEVVVYKKILNFCMKNPSQVNKLFERLSGLSGWLSGADLDGKITFQNYHSLGKVEKVSYRKEETKETGDARRATISMSVIDDFLKAVPKKK